MKNFLLVIIISLVTVTTCYSQQAIPDTNFIVRINAVEWLPDGKQVLLSAVKFHKTEQRMSPISRVFIYDLTTKKLTPSLTNATNIAVSPNGKYVAFFKRDDKRRENIYIHNLTTGSETELKTDTFKKFSLSWSPDGRKLTYNISYNGEGQYATIDICIVNIFTKQVKQISHSGKYKSYNPVWGPDGKHIVYYLEKGDRHDQIYLTDTNGSFHRNITNDTTTLNYYPSWIDNKTILYTVNPNQIATIRTDGNKKQVFLELKTDRATYNSASRRIAYIDNSKGNKVMIYDPEKKTNIIIADDKMLIGLL